MVRNRVRFFSRCLSDQRGISCTPETVSSIGQLPSVIQDSAAAIRDSSVLFSPEFCCCDRVPP